MTTGMGDGSDRMRDGFLEMMRQANACTHTAGGQRIDYFILDGVMYRVDRGPCDMDGVPLWGAEAESALEYLAGWLGMARTREPPRYFEIRGIEPMSVSVDDDGKWKPPGGYPRGKGRRW